MSHAHAEQLRKDLETLRNVVGTELPFDRVDVRLTAAIGLAVILPALVNLAGVQSRQILLALFTPLFIAMLTWMVRNWRATHPSRPCSVAKRRQIRPGMWYSLLLLPMIYGYSYWAKTAGAPSGVVNGTVLLLICLTLVLNAFSDPRRYASLCVAVPVMIGGLFWPYLEHFHFFRLLLLLFAIGMLTAAALMDGQLRQQENQASHAGN